MTHDVDTLPRPALPTRFDDDALRIARRGVWLLAIGLGGFLLWACLAPLDQGVVGSGTVVVAGERKSVQTLLGGAIERILVSEGEQVTRGQRLVQLNTVQTQSQLDVALAQWVTARSVEARLSAERMNHDPIAWPEDLLARADDPRAKAAMELQAHLFAERREALAGQLKILEHERASLAEQLAVFKEVKRSYDAQAEYQREELQGVRELAEKGIVPRNRRLDAERAAAQLGGQQAAASADIGRTEQALQQNQLKAAQQVQAFRTDAGAQLTQVAAEASSLSDRVAALEFEVRNGAVVAPVDGQVIELAVHTEGGVVPAGQKLMDIVPQGSAWVVKAQFPPLLADKLTPGLPVDVRFATLHRVTTPVIEGRVATVSADRLIDERTHESYFAVEVVPGPQVDLAMRSAGVDVKPGMQAEVIVRMGERTLFNYLTKPLVERLVSAFKEE